MNSLRTRLVALVLVLGIGAALAVRLRAQAAPAPAQQDVLPALLTEVRALRVAMEQMASAGPRVQLALGRLQLQEQRINTMVRRLESVRDQRANIERELEMKQLQFKMMTAGEPSSNPGEREMHEHVVASTKSELARATAEIQRLTTEDNDLQAQIAAEQSRWTLINQQLEELERSLGRR